MYIDSKKDMQLMRKQVAVEVFVERPSGQSRYFLSDAPKFLKITLEWQLLQLGSAVLVKNVNSSMT